MNNGIGNVVPPPADSILWTDGRALLAWMVLHPCVEMLDRDRCRVVDIRWIAMDDGGYWYGYFEKPQTDLDDSRGWGLIETNANDFVGLVSTTTWYGSWTDTLIEVKP